MLRVETSSRVPPVRGPGAFQQGYEHPWSAESHAAAKLLLPGPLGEFFGDARVANCHDLVDQAPMQPLALGGEVPFTGGLASSRGQISFAVLPRQTLLSRFFDAAQINRRCRGCWRAVAGPSGAASSPSAPAVF